MDLTTVQRYSAACALRSTAWHCDHQWLHRSNQRWKDNRILLDSQSREHSGQRESQHCGQGSYLPVNNELISRLECWRCSYYKVKIGHFRLTGKKLPTCASCDAPLTVNYTSGLSEKDISQKYFTTSSLNDILMRRQSLIVLKMVIFNHNM